jgi:hypothetical protein
MKHSLGFSLFQRLGVRDAGGRDGDAGEGSESRAEERPVVLVLVLRGRVCVSPSVCSVWWGAVAKAPVCPVIFLHRFNQLHPTFPMSLLQRTPNQTLNTEKLG